MFASPRLALLRSALRQPATMRRAAAAALVVAPSSLMYAAHCEASSASKGHTSLSLWQQAANLIYQSPFKAIVGIIVPAYALVFAMENSNPRTAGMLLSQKLIHTRVYGQAIAVATTVGVMSFVSMMDKEGVYRIQNGEVVRGKEQSRVRHWYSKTAEDQKADEQKLSDRYEQQYGTKIDVLLPLIYAPLLPLVWIGLRNRIPAHQLTKIIMGITGVAFVHGVYIMVSDSSMVMG